MATVNGGAAALLRYGPRWLNCTLTEGQAQLLWQECRDNLLSRHHLDAVLEIERDGPDGLDTINRDDLADALARVLAGNESWPLNSWPESTRMDFHARVRAALLARGYTFD